MDNHAKLRQALVEALLKNPDINLRRVRRKVKMSGRQTRIAARIAKAYRKNEAEELVRVSNLISEYKAKSDIKAE